MLHHLALPLAVSAAGPAGTAGAGALSLPAQLSPNPGSVGLSLYLQAGFLDSAAVQGVSFTQGLELEIG